MDSYHDVDSEHESCAKRMKYDEKHADISVLCTNGQFSTFQQQSNGTIDIVEAVSADCDSGYEASTLESIPTSSHQTSPHTDSSGDIQETLSNLSEIFQTPLSQIDHLETSQDSIGNDDEDEDDVDEDVEEDDGDDDDNNDNASTVSHLSDLSGLSELSGQDWKPMAGSMIWIQKQMQSGVNPRSLLSDLGIDLEQIPQYVDEVTLWKLIINMLAEPPRRNKLRHVNTLDDVVRLIKGAQNIIVLTGAGVSVSCGIPDFRSRDGIYSRLAIDFPDLPDPQAMFDINYFSQDPRPFFKFARDIYPGKFKPSPCHSFIKLLEKYKKLLRNYTQNIDTLEKVANIERVIECHGSFATATCTKCGHKVTADHIRDIVLEQKIPLCPICHPDQRSISTDNNDDDIDDGNLTNYSQLVSSGIMKPDIVFFGEGLPDTFHEAMANDKTKCDLLLVIGSSLKVRPVALIPSSLPPNVPQILINRESLPHCHFDVELLGDCDVIINHLCHLFGGVWTEGVYDEIILQEAQQLLPLEQEQTTAVGFNSEPLIRAEPNCTINIGTDNLCKCNSSTNCSSFNNVLTNCNCNNDMSIISQQQKDENLVNSTTLDLKQIKERHMSVDSTKDSGIGENSNFTNDLIETTNDQTLIATTTNSVESETDDMIMKDYWQPKIRKSLADRLPSNSYYLIKPSRYIFPGAEYFYDPDEKFVDNEESEESESSTVVETTNTIPTISSSDSESERNESLNN